MLRLKTKLIDSAVRGFDKDFKTAKFLFDQDSFLKNYNFNKANGNLYTAENMIQRYCAAYDINQRLILVTLEREGGHFISTKTAAEALEKKNDAGLPALDWACCVGVPDSLKLQTKYQGFENQIAGACAIYDRWFKLYKPETIKELVKPDPELLCIPESAATFALLMYTPHADSLTLTENLFRKYGF